MGTVDLLILTSVTERAPPSITEPTAGSVGRRDPDHGGHPPARFPHRRRIADRIVFDKLIQVLVLGPAYERIADAVCSVTTIRARQDDWIDAGLVEHLEQIALGSLRSDRWPRPGPPHRRWLHRESTLRRPDGRAVSRRQRKAGNQTLATAPTPWQNRGFNKLAICIERHARVIDASIALSNAVIIT